MHIDIKHLIYFFLLVTITLSCKSKSQNNIDDIVVEKDNTNYIEDAGPKSYIPQINDTIAETRKIKDGVYTADVEYYNNTTGINTLYVTKVHVEDGYLRVIKWPNGVWLASELFNPQKIKKDGTCIISNIEAGYENRVKILDLEYY
ncbi:MAG TPA: hypothetical protein VLZ75_07665 [Chitinophagales bacterium]|nr:hypothetical protein [Chitinophagales bacterium]